MPAFTRQHYTQVANILHTVRDPEERDRLAEQFAAMFRRDNPRFDDHRFIQAVHGQAPRGRSHEAHGLPPRPHHRLPHRAYEAARGEGYQGWANWETWNVALWFGNDEGLYHAVRDYPHRFTAASAKDFVIDMLPNGTPDFERREAARSYAKVRWGEIARAFNEMRS
jgi:hypothetical protein